MVSVTERAGGRGRIREAFGLIPRITLQPGRGVRLLQAHAGARAVGVRVTHSVVGPWTILAEELARNVVSVNRGTDAVHHVCHSSDCVVREVDGGGELIVDS